jgi:hypothetical protein
MRLLKTLSEWRLLQASVAAFSQSSYLWAGVLALVLSACGGGGSGESTSAGTNGGSGSTSAGTGSGGGTPAAKAFPSPHSGITANQCYQAGSNPLVGCTSTGATSLNNQQDGMRTNIHARNYSLVPKAAGGTYLNTECVKDNVTGLIWEGKTASGNRAGSTTYTHYDVAYYGTQVQMDASNNSYGYVAYVNSIALCGYRDWRLPTVEELQTIVDYSVFNPSINATWFPNTAVEFYWATSNYVGNSNYAWAVYFFNGFVFNGYSRDYDYAVRLVRASQ